MENYTCSYGYCTVFRSIETLCTVFLCANESLFPCETQLCDRFTEEDIECAHISCFHTRTTTTTPAPTPGPAPAPTNYLAGVSIGVVVAAVFLAAVSYSLYRVVQRRMARNYVILDNDNVDSPIIRHEAIAMSQINRNYEEDSV